MTISQPFNNVALVPQTGGEFVAKVATNFEGGDALIGFSASAYVAQPGLMTMQLWLDGEPVAQIGLLATQAETHMSLGHTWAYCPDVSAGQHTISLLAGEGTVTDQNDSACVTVWNLNGTGTLRYHYDADCPDGAGQPLINTEVLTEGGPLYISADMSGRVETPSLITGWLPLDGGDPYELNVFANNAQQRLALIGTDRIYTPQDKGQHQVQLNADGLTFTDGDDAAHLTVVELTEGVVMQAQLQNVTANSQQGDGGTIAETTFQSNGGPLLVRVAASVWTEQPNEVLFVGIQIDGTSLGFGQIYANNAAMHMPVVTNDLVLLSVPAGPHSLTLLAEANVITDQNDRVSALILEFSQ
jgi:hypothetical protein